MAVFRKRLIFWLIKAYIQRWGKVIAFSFLLGLVIFFGLAFSLKYVSKYIPTERKARIGVIGAYTANNLPPFVTNDISHGLTKVGPDGRILPDVASKWEIKNNGRTYSFHLNPAYSFSDGTPLTSRDIHYNFAQVKVDTSDPKIITFHLADDYSPFLVTVSRPIFKNGYIGVGEYKVSQMELNGEFVESLSITSNKNRFFSETYVFYPTEEALKHAFVLGEVTQARGLTGQTFRNTEFRTFPGVKVSRDIDYSRLVAVFFNTQDPYLSDKKVRNALTYALPDTFAFGERTSVPYPPQSTYLNQEMADRRQDIAHAKLLLGLDEASEATNSANVTIKVASRYHEVAEVVAKEWKKLGINAKIEDEESIPSTF